MAQAGGIEEQGEPLRVVRVHHRARTAGKWAGFALLGLLLLLGALFLWVNSDPGRRYVVNQINNIEAASGLRVGVGRIEGSVFGELKLHDLTLSDPKGIFFRAPLAELDYRPLAYLRDHVDIRSLVIPQARLYRTPELRPGDPDAPLLPDLDIDIGRLQIGRMSIDPTVTGRRHLMSLDGRVKIADGRAEIGARAAALRGPGLPGGDRLALRLDAVPEENRLSLGMRLQAPADGFVATMTGVAKPLALAIDGRGSWQDWQGRARAGVGGEAAANLSVRAQDGTFTIMGPTRPGLFLAEGPVQRLVAPLTQINLVTTLEERRADLRLRLNSQAVAIAAEGLVDLGQSRFQDLKVAARLIQPGAMAPGLRGRDVRIALLLNGQFATPMVAYDLRAGAIGFGPQTLEGLRATGRARVQSDRILIPISARAQRISGLDESIGGLLTNVSLDGDLAISGSRMLSDNLRIRSDRVNATAVIAFDLARGEYRTALQGRVNNYLVDGVGLVDIDTNLNVVNEAGGFGIRGRFAARTRRIDNASVRDFLGGTAVVSAGLAMNPAGVVTLDNIRLNAPQLRITSGSGTYMPDGRINFRLNGNSNAYGPLAVLLTGTAAAPQVRIQAANPGFGIGLRGIDATVRSTAGGWAIQATGQSQYGPFSADIVVLTGRGPMTIQVNRLTFAGMNFQGRVVQTAGGIFIGTLSMSGQGLNGIVRLSAEGRYQRADVSATANAAQIPGDVPVQIQRGIIQASVILYPDAPSIVGDAQLAGVRSGSLLVQQARARINYRGGRGQVQLLAEGRSGVPFRVAVNAALTPELIRAAAQGRVNNIDFRFAQPAEIRKVGADWQLSPTRIVLPQGNVRLAGRYGNGLVVQSRLDGLDLSILNAISPGLGIGGRATGSLDFAQPSGSSFPRAEARLNIENFTRTGIAIRSAPVNMAVAASLRPEGGSLNAIIRRGGTVIGRAQARLQPLGPSAGSWSNRLLASPLAGGLRYNGPADVLMSLVALPGHQLSGPIGIAVDFSGRVQAPQFNGVVRSTNLTYVNEQYGTRITNLALAGRFNASQFQFTQLSGQAGEGTVTGEGTIGLASAAGFPMDIRLVFDRARLARGDDLGATATGNVRVTNSRADGALISGELDLPEVRYQIVRQGAAEIPQLQGVRRRGEPIPPPGAQPEAQGVPSIWKLDLRVRADNRVFVSGMGLESEWSTDLRVRGTSATPTMVGNLELIRGTLSLAGRRFEVQEGAIAFTGARPPNPRIDIRAVADIDDVEVAIEIGGTAYAPQIAFSSQPGLPQDEIVSRILFGNSVGEISALQAVQVAASLNALRGGSGGLNPMGQLRSATGIDRLRVLGADDTTGRGTAIAAGMYLSNNIYIEIITDAKGFTATQIEVALTRALSLLSQFGASSGTNVNVRYSKDY